MSQGPNLQVRTKTMFFFLCFSWYQPFGLQKPQGFTNGFLQAEKNMGHFFLPLKISGRIVGLCIKGS